MLRDRVRECMAPDPLRGAAGRASFAFGPGFPGFRGHFPSGAVLPGVCIVQSLVVAVEARHGRSLPLRRIGSAKFVSPVRPGETLEIEWRERTLDDGTLAASGSATCGGRRVAEVRVDLGAP